MKPAGTGSRFAASRIRHVTGLPPRDVATSRVEHLVRRGTALASEGKLEEAGALFGQAAVVHREAGHRDGEARCLTLLAQCRRLLGDRRGSSVAIGRARRLAPEGGAAAVAAAIEKAEVDVAHGDLEDAVLALDDALRWRAATVAPGAADARLLRRRAIIQGGLGRVDAAARDLAAAAGLLDVSGEHATARRVLVERATILHQASDRAAFHAALGEARRAIDDSGDRALAGELDLLEGAVAISDGRLDDAMALSRLAGEHALASVQPTTYVGSCLALSQLADVRGDRVAAYEALAVGWATLGDLIGKAGARQVFQPHMQSLEGSWGPQAFAEARQSYEDRRRRQLGITTT
jgi:tetratricopeptide (TPR) repeat protein